MLRLINPFTSWIIIVLLILSSTRGALIIHFDFSYKTVYPVVSGALLVVALIGALYSRIYLEKYLTILKFALVVNLLLFLFHIAFNFAFDGFDILVVKWNVLLFSAPYVIFIGLLLKEKYIESILIIITLLIAFSVIYNFSEMIGTNAEQYLLEYRTKLRGKYIGMSNSGVLYGTVIQRIGGYTGSMHDSGNILGMLSVFFFVSFFVKKTNPNLWLFILSFIALLMTQSLANIIVTIFTMIVFYLHILTHRTSMKTIIFGVIAIVLFLVSTIYLHEIIDVIFSRLINVESRDGMLNQLSLDDLILSIPVALSGHAMELDSEQMNVEITLLKLIYQLNIFHATLYSFILLYPFYIFVKYYKFTNTIIELYPPLAVNIFGFLSLLHYGSLLRSTSIFLYFIISALFMLIFYKHKYLNSILIRA
jgi:hypothetical protein